MSFLPTLCNSRKFRVKFSAHSTLELSCQRCKSDYSLGLSLLGEYQLRCNFSLAWWVGRKSGHQVWLHLTLIGMRCPTISVMHLLQLRILTRRLMWEGDFGSASWQRVMRNSKRGISVRLGRSVWIRIQGNEQSWDIPQGQLSSVSHHQAFLWLYLDSILLHSAIGQIGAVLSRVPQKKISLENKCPQSKLVGIIWDQKKWKLISSPWRDVDRNLRILRGGCENGYWASYLVILSSSTEEVIKRFWDLTGNSGPKLAIGLLNRCLHKYCTKLTSPSTPGFCSVSPDILKSGGKKKMA